MSQTKFGRLCFCGGVLLLYASVGPMLVSSLHLTSATATIISDIFFFVILFSHYMWVQKDVFQEYIFDAPPKNNVLAHCGEILAYLLGFIAVYDLGQMFSSWIYSTFGDSRFDAYQGKLDIGVGITILLICVLAPLCEEFLFRYLTQRTLSDIGGIVFGIFGQAVIFALMHGTVTHLPSVFLFGVFLGLVTMRYGIWASVGLHALFNLMADTSFPITLSQAFSSPYAFIPASILLCGLMLYLPKVYCCRLAHPPVAVCSCDERS